jgi:hypothetical protein
MDYLLTSTGEKIKITANNPYQDIWALDGCPDFFMAKDSIVAMPLAPTPSQQQASQDRIWCVQSEKESKELTDFLTEWKKPSGANLYRGIPGCHFCWKRMLREGAIFSEGNNDIPMATMGNKLPTCWLPSAWDLGTAQSCALSCLAKASAPVMTYLKLMHTKVVDPSHPSRFPVGIVIKIPVRLHGAVRICWLNACEIVAKGPLSATQFSVHQIAWLTVQGPDFTNTTLSAQDLFPVRPYEPKNDDWFPAWRTPPASYDWLKQSAVK